jgi:serine/threonine protein phosphatase PrpC
MERFNIEITTAVEENYKGQDQPFHGITPSGKIYFGIWDGHGSNSVIQELRSIVKRGKLDEIMDTESPVITITDHLLSTNICRTYESSGTTMNFCIFDGNTLSCSNCGDSRTFVFRNGECIFISEDHNSKNEKERERLQGKVKYSPSQSLRMISESELTCTPAEYIQFQNGNLLAISQAIGHNNITGIDPTTISIAVESTDKIVALCVSDGVVDMLWKDDNDEVKPSDLKMLYSFSADDLKNKILSRWLQPWDMTNLNGEYAKGISYDKSDCDDIGITRFVLKPKNIHGEYSTENSTNSLSG